MLSATLTLVLLQQTEAHRHVTCLSTVGHFERTKYRRQMGANGAFTEAEIPPDFLIGFSS